MGKVEIKLKVVAQLLKLLKTASSKDSRIGWAHAKLQELKQVDHISAAALGQEKYEKIMKDIDNAATSVNMDRSDLPDKKEVTIGWLSVDQVLSEGGSGDSLGKRSSGSLTYVALGVAVISTVIYIGYRFRKSKSI